MIAKQQVAVANDVLDAWNIANSHWMQQENWITETIDPTKYLACKSNSPELDIESVIIKIACKNDCMFDTSA